MKLRPFRAAVALTAALTTAAAPLSAAAQTTYEFKKYAPRLAVEGSGSGQTPGSGGGGNPPTPQSALQLSTSILNFGDTSTLTPTTRQVTVTNTGKAPLTFTAASSVQGTSFSLSASTCSTSLPAGQSCTVDVRFAPSGGGPFSGKLTLASALPTSPHEVTLQGSGLVPWSPSTFDAQSAVSSVSAQIGDNGHSVRSSNGNGITATSFASVSSGKWYFEARVPATPQPFCGFGIRPKEWDKTSTSILRSGYADGYAFALTGTQLDWGFNRNLGWWPEASVANRVIGVSLDMDNRKVTFNILGTNYGPYALAAPAGTAYAVAGSGWSSCYWVVNFGQAAFTHAVPAGYNAGF